MSKNKLSYVWNSYNENLANVWYIIIGNGWTSDKQETLINLFTIPKEEHLWNSILQIFEGCN